METGNENLVAGEGERISKLGAIQIHNEERLATVPLYYYAERSAWYGADGNGAFSKYSDSHAKSYVAEFGFHKRTQDAQGNTPVDRAMLYLQQRNRVSYAGQLAGYTAGIHKINDSRILITDSPRIIQPQPGECATIRLLIESLFFDEQHRGQATYFYLWLSKSFQTFFQRITENETKNFRHCPALAIFGPRGCGKTALIDLIIAPLFGGRKADPMNYLREPKFNKELFAASILVLDDKGACASSTERKQRGEGIKDLIWKPDQRMEGKGVDALNLRPFWRLVIAGNDDDAGLQVCPTLSPSLEDKLLILRATKAEQLPETNEENDAWAASIAKELPAFAAYLLSWQAPFGLTLDPRTRLVNFQHPQIVSALRELQPEMRLLELIDTLDLIDCEKEFWEGKASEFETALRRKDTHGIYQNHFGGSSTGRMLSELSRTNPDRIKKTDRQGTSHYKIFRAK